MGPSTGLPLCPELFVVSVVRLRECDRLVALQRDTASGVSSTLQPFLVRPLPEGLGPALDGLAHVVAQLAQLFKGGIAVGAMLAFPFTPEAQDHVIAQLALITTLGDVRELIPQASDEPGLY